MTMFFTDCMNCTQPFISTDDEFEYHLSNSAVEHLVLPNARIKHI